MGCTPSTTVSDHPEPLKTVFPSETSVSPFPEPTSVFHIALIGHNSCGKTSFVQRILNNPFSEVPPTDILISRFFFYHTGEVITKEQVKPEKWNSSSIIEIQEHLTKDETLQDTKEMRAVRGLFLSFALNDRESFNSLFKLKMRVIKNYTIYTKLPKYIIGLKADLDTGEVTKEDVDKLIAWLERPPPDDKEGNDNQEENTASWKYFKVAVKDAQSMKNFLTDLKGSIETVFN